VTPVDPIVVLVEDTPHVRSHAQQLEVIAGDEQCPRIRGGVVVGHARRHLVGSREARECRLLRLHLAEHRIAERRTALLARRGTALQWAGMIEERELAGILHRQLPEQDAIHQREDRRGRADPERERQDRRQRIERRAGEATNRVTDR